MSEFETIFHPKHPYTKAFINSIKVREWHWHHDFEFIIMLRGRITVQTLQTQTEMTEGDFYLLHPREVHRITSDSMNNEIGLVQINPTFCESYYPPLQRLEFIDPFISSDFADPFAGLIRKMMVCLLSDSNRSEHNPLHHMAQINALFYGCVECFAVELHYESHVQMRNKNQESIVKILDFLHSSYMDSVTLQDLANYVNLDRAYLSRYFKKMFSINFSTYLTEIRLNHVAFLLRQTSRSVTDIAYSSGFSDLRTFNKHFLKKFQCSPHEYRKQDDQPRLETADASVQSSCICQLKTILPLCRTFFT